MIQQTRQKLAKLQNAFSMMEKVRIAERNWCPNQHQLAASTSTRFDTYFVLIGKGEHNK
jgi:hypothetical protein